MEKIEAFLSAPSPPGGLTTTTTTTPPPPPRVRVASPHDAVLNSECAYTFHSPYTSPKGILVDLRTFVGTVEELAATVGEDGDGDGDVDDEPSSSSRGLFVRIVKRRAAKEERRPAGGDGAAVVDDATPSTDVEGPRPTKLGVGITGGFASESDKYETLSTYSVVLLRRRRTGTVAPENTGCVVVEAEVPYNDATESSFPAAVRDSVTSVIHHAGLSVRQDLTAWELDAEPKPVSKYAADLPFVENGAAISPDPKDWKCEKSGATDHLWLNLSDGFVGGGRKFWDGSGGTNGALEHFLETGEQYPLVVKLGTITEHVDAADCYSYAKDEDGPVKVPNLRELLERRGINVAGMQKTVKSTAELEVELNATYAFDAITESGGKLVPVSGPGLHGLQNLGNSCYVNSVVQMLFGGTIPELASRYGCGPTSDEDGARSSPSLTANPLLRAPPTEASDDLLCQTAKLSCALTSGAFCGPAPSSPDADFEHPDAADPKHRLAPRMFKHAAGRDHVDFRTGQQQDAAQYFQHLLEKLDRAELGAAASARLKGGGADGAPPVTSNLFAFRTESRVVCGADDSVKYNASSPETMLSIRIPLDRTAVSGVASETPPDTKRRKAECADDGKEGDEKTEEKEKVPTVSFQACLDAWAAPSVIDDYRWPHLGNATSPATSRSRFANFPRYLVVHMQRYELGEDWQPKKIEANVDVPEEVSLEGLRSTGPREGEKLAPEEAEGESSSAGGMSTAPPAQPAVDEGALAQLMDMGFHMNGCKRALVTVGGTDVEAAMNWIFEHNADPNFNDPLPEPSSSAVAAPSSGGGDSGVDEGTVASLVENLGCFAADHVRAALKHCGGAADRAADWLFSHMDDLDGAIALLESASPPAATGSASSVVPSTPLEDGNGQYRLIGLVSHIGKNTGSGHYVVHLKKDGKWVIFNDEKVALSENPPFQHAYMYLFQRTDAVSSPNPNY